MFDQWGWDLPVVGSSENPWILVGRLAHVPQSTASSFGHVSRGGNSMTVPNSGPRRSPYFLRELGIPLGVTPPPGAAYGKFKRSRLRLRQTSPARSRPCRSDMWTRILALRKQSPPMPCVESGPPDPRPIERTVPVRKENLLPVYCIDRSQRTKVRLRSRWPHWKGRQKKPRECRDNAKTKLHAKACELI